MKKDLSKAIYLISFVINNVVILYQMETKRQIQSVDIVILFLYAFCLIFSSIPSINKISLYVLIPIMGIVLFIKNNSIFYSGKYLSLYLVLVVWMAFTSITAQNTDVAFRHMVRILSSYIISVISYYLAIKYSLIKRLYWLILITFIIILFNADFGNWVIAESADDRDQFSGTNANMFSYYLIYANFSLFMLIKIYRRNNFILYSISVLSLILSLYISLVTASRQILVLQIPLIILMTIVTQNRVNKKNIILSLCLILLIVILAQPIVNRYLSNSLLSERFIENVKDDVRITLIHNAMYESSNRPLLGIGPNNFVEKYSMFTHNTYLELLVSSGLPAVIIYIMITFRFMLIQLKRYKRTKDKTFLMFFVYAAVFIVSNVFYVYIGNLWLMGIFFITVGHSEAYFKNKYLLI